jgi:hypothetical protein
MRAILLIGAMTSVLVLAEPSAFAEPCDRTLSPSPVTGPDGYLQRAGGERCEGIYVSPVSGTPVELVSLTRGRLSYDPAHPAVLSVTLDQTPASGGAHVRAVGIPRRLYYQMDADIVGGRAVAWPAGDVLVRRQIMPDQLGILASRKDASSDTVFLAVDVVPTGATPAHDQPIVMLLRVVDVTDLKWRFVPKGQVASASYAPASVKGDRAEVVLPSADEPLAGTLEVRWSDPGSGKSATRTFRIGN